MRVFEKALQGIEVGRWGLFGPIPFQEYAKSTGQRAKTCTSISVDSLSQLDPYLRKTNTMVFRLGGSEKGRETKFALITTPDRLYDFFLIHSEVFRYVTPQTFLPMTSLEVMFQYLAFPKLTEKCAVNLAFASGLVGYGLELDTAGALPAPATGSSTYTFKFRPHEDYDVVLTHDRGQVEVDAVFTGHRHGRDCLFVMECKAGRIGSLAKHKLVYPILALAPHVPPDIPIIPVYMLAEVEEKGIVYHLLECDFPDPRIGLKPPAISALRAERDVHLSLPLQRLV